MPFRIKNLAHTRRDPNKRGHKNPTVRRAAARMRIGQRRIRIGKSILISDNVYVANKPMIDIYLEQKLISLQAIGEDAAGMLGGEQPQLYAPSPEPPVPSPSGEEGSSEESGVVEISTDDPDESGGGAVILDMAPAEAEAEEAPEPKEAKTSKKSAKEKSSESAKAEESAKRTSRRRKKKDD